MDLKHNVWFFKNALDKEWCNNLIKKQNINNGRNGSTRNARNVRQIVH